MKKVLKNHKLIESPWMFIEGLTEDSTPAHAMVPLRIYLDNQKLVADRSDIGVWVNSDEEIEDLVDYISCLPLIALNFPVFSDGRSYSTAQVLRTRYHYQGELRATGDVRFDQLEQMVRCGFDTFEMENEKDLYRAISEFKGFSSHYQKSDTTQSVSQAFD